MPLVRTSFRAGKSAPRLAKNPGMRPEDVLISPLSVTPEGWSFGEGKDFARLFAQVWDAS